MATPRFVVLDTETTGLEADKNCILELGIQLYTGNLELIDYASWICSDDLTIAHVDWMLQDKDSSFVANMHQKNGLIKDIRQQHADGKLFSQADIAQFATKFIGSYDLGKSHVRLPLTGSSIAFDRNFISRQMPELNECFHYRNIDVSSIKEALRIFRPDVIEKREREWEEKGGAVHRVLDDCTDSRDELAFYAEHVFLWTED